MASYTFYPDADAYLMSESASWTQARDGLGTFTAYSSGATLTLGKLLSSGTYYAYEAFLSFDTSSIPDTAEITAAVLSVAAAVTDSKTWTLQAKAFDWGGTLSSSDWQDATEWAALTLLAEYAMSGGWTSGNRYNLTEYGTNLQAAINKTGSTRMILASSNISGIAPSGDDATQMHASEATGTTNDPKLEVTTFEPPSFTPFVMWIG